LRPRRFNEQVLAVREHLVMDQRMRTPKVLAEIPHSSTNLWQFHLELASQRMQDVRFGQIAE
jgi:hypothetical protein